MSNIFNFKRFADYFLYDLRGAKNRYGITLLAAGFSIVIAFVLIQSCGLLFERHLVDMSGAMGQILAVAVSFCVVTLSAATRIYGDITNKRSGVSFVMLPASVFEKTLSLCIILLVVLPGLLLVILSATDILLSLCFPNLYGSYVLLRYYKNIVVTDGLEVNYAAFMYASWVISILFFCLGALVFKRAKIAKTLLCGFVLSFVVEVIVILFFVNGDTFPGVVENDLAEFFKAMNIFLNICMYGFGAMFIAGIYYRLKTIKL